MSRHEPVAVAGSWVAPDAGIVFGSDITGGGCVLLLRLQAVELSFDSNGEPA